MPLLSAPIRYAGSKASLMPKLCELMPRHTRYVSVFGGSGADILNKPVSRSETWNDLDDRLYNLFSVLKRPKDRKQLFDLVLHTMHSRREFTVAQRLLHDPASSPVQRAWATVVTGNQGRAGVHFSNKSPSQWSYYRLPNVTLRWPRVPHILAQFANRFRHVILENLSWEEVFDKYDAPTTLFYCDPPYVHSTRVSVKTLYAHEMTDDDHRRFLDRILEVEGRVMVSGYDHPIYAEALKHWKRYEFATVASISTAKKRPCRTEVVWLNYIPGKGVKK